MVEYKKLESSERVKKHGTDLYRAVSTVLTITEDTRLNLSSEIGISEHSLRLHMNGVLKKISKPLLAVIAMKYGVTDKEFSDFGLLLSVAHPSDIIRGAIEYNKDAIEKAKQELKTD